MKSEQVLCSEERRRKKAKYWCIGLTVLYIFLAGPFFHATLIPTLMGMPHVGTIFSAILVYLLALCLPLSVPITVFLIWSKYGRREYKKILKLAPIPFYLLIFEIALFSMINSFYGRW